MTTKTEALKLALEALYPISHNATDDPRGQADKAITAIEAALAQPYHIPDAGKLVTKPLSLPEQEYLDAVAATLMREGVAKHRAKEYAQHFFKLAQPEPVLINGLTKSETSASMSVMGLSKPKREWVGLTDDVILDVAQHYSESEGFWQGAIWSHDKLKELNHVGA